LKKIFLTGLILSLFLLTGCGKYNEKTIVKDLNKKSEITEDELKSDEDNIQKLTDKYVAEIDKIFENKEKEIMTV